MSGPMPTCLRSHLEGLWNLLFAKGIVSGKILSSCKFSSRSLSSDKVMRAEGV